MMERLASRKFGVDTVLEAVFHILMTGIIGEEMYRKMGGGEVAPSYI